MSADSERPRLRDYRSQLGWTQQQMADRLAHLAWMQHREHVAVNADMVAKWERGAKGVSPRYRELLCRLFGVTAAQLGLRHAPAATAPRDRFPESDESLVSMLDNAAQLLDQLGAAGGALAPHLLRAWKDTVTARRTLLGLLDPARTDPAGRACAATATVADLEQLAERYEALHETADPATLLTPVVAHLRMTADALGRGRAHQERRRLLRNQARVALLAGRLAAEDLGDPLSGRAYLGLACDTACDAGDERLVAVALGHAACLAAAEGMTTTALDHLAMAVERAPTDPAVRCWLFATAATIHAERGDGAAARNALDHAQAACRVSVSSEDGTTADLAAAAGHVLLRAGEYGGARDALATALGRLGRPARRQRVLVLADLALVELHRGDLAAACSRASQVADLLRQVTYAVGSARLRAFRDAAARPLTKQALRALDEQLHGVAA